jgi:hypothetical protein
MIRVFLYFPSSQIPVRVEPVETILSPSDENQESLAKHAKGAKQNKTEI